MYVANLPNIDNIVLFIPMHNEFRFLKLTVIETNERMIFNYYRTIYKYTQQVVNAITLKYVKVKYSI